ncbi:DUF3944 domain-containing protein [Burkholderia cepacia]|uniref:DUF3944 domain-containing protein n=1 Tax=Burkholderia TaxID=32008 RepID=UPI000F13FA49|nr:DUF3944 domain-containing protein [Burkholderia pseudomallei]VBG63282.1 Uncharacterized protein conserved in bacteria [Burkholderia pseudomallei]
MQGTTIDVVTIQPSTERRIQMAYRHDPDLAFLGKMKSSDLNDLVRCLTHDKDGSARLTEELTMADDYKKYAPDHSKYWQLIAAEVQCFGGNTFATMFRGGKGVLYKEVLCDVCDKMDVNYNAKSSVETIEGNLLMKILQDALAKMTPEELRELAKELGIKDFANITSPALVMVFQTIFRAGGFKSYQLTLIVVNAVLKALIGRGLSFGGNILLTRTMAILTGPVGWIISGVWTAVDIAGAAYRVTIPAVIQIAALRQQQMYGDMAEQVKFG